MNWIRVKPNDRCTVCGKPDYCTYSRELALAHCMRIASSRPSKNKMGGHFHPLDGATIAALPQRKPEPPRPTIDAPGMINRWFAQTARSQYEPLAQALGVSVAALLSLKCAWAPGVELRALKCRHETWNGSWAFPQRNGSGDVVGLRLRTNDGDKSSVTGGRDGIFLPWVKPQGRAWCPEGPTDTAALLTLGKFAVGRPSNSGGIAYLSATLARLRIHEAVILADNDEDKIRPNGDRWNPGLDGAQRLAEEIGVPCCIVILPCKDCRELVRLGGTAELLDSMLQSLVWHVPKKRNVEHGNHFTEPSFSRQDNSPFA